MSLQLPNNYVNVAKNEMEYIAGGDGDFTTAISNLGTIAISMGIFAFEMGKTQTLTNYQSNAVYTAIGGAAILGAIQLTTIERIAWNSVKLHYTGKMYSGGGFVG